MKKKPVLVPLKDAAQRLGVSEAALEGYGRQGALKIIRKGRWFPKTFTTESSLLFFQYVIAEPHNVVL